MLRAVARVRDLRAFRAAVRDHRRAVGRTQQQLARSIGLHPDVLSHKLNERDNAVLTVPDVIGIVTTLASWGALVTTADAVALLDLMEVPRHALPASAWSAPPLSGLRAGEEGAAPTRQVSRHRDNLAVTPPPCPATPLVGRERERAAVAALLAKSRLVTLCGVGGVGKTRLAIQVARDLAGDFSDGVTFIDLAALRDPALLGTTLARALGLSPTSAQAAETCLAEALGNREILLVVDNLEHLLAEVPLLTRLLSATEAVRVLATSRVPLRLYGEHILRVPPLHLPGKGQAVEDSEAARLFLARAREIRPDLALDSGDMVAVGEICTALDGLPLAIELAAAQVRLYTPEALLPLLRDRLALLTGGPRDVPKRQQTLRAALDWSYALLPSASRRMFAHLGVLVGPFDAAAAAAVSGEHGPVDELAGLADQSLLEVSAGDPPAFRMLEIVREYALTRLAETADGDAARRRHLTHFLAVALAARDGLEGPEQARVFDRLEAAYPNMRTALEFAFHHAEYDSRCVDDGLRLGAALSQLWQRRGTLAEGVLHLDRLLAVDDALGCPSSPQIRAAAVLAACTLACFQGDYPRTEKLARHGIELCAPLADHAGLARAYRFLGEAALAVGERDRAEPHFQRQLDEALRAGDIAGQADAYNMLAQTARYQEDFRRAQALLWRALNRFRQAGNPDGVAVVLSSLGEVARDAGRPAATRRLFTAALRGHAALGNKRHVAYELEGLAAAAALEDAGRQALVYLGAAQKLREETGGPQPPAERAILDRILAPAIAGLSARERFDALDQGRSQPLSAVVEQALEWRSAGRPADAGGR